MNCVRIAAFRPSATFLGSDVQSIGQPPRAYQRAASGLPGLRTREEERRERKVRLGKVLKELSVGTLESNERREAERDAWYEARHDEWMAQIAKLRRWRQATGNEHATPRQMREMGL